MFAAEQEFMIAALGETLLEFSSTQPASPIVSAPPRKKAKDSPSQVVSAIPCDDSKFSLASGKKSAISQSPSRIADVDPRDPSRKSPASGKKRKRKPKTPSPKQHRPRKGQKKELLEDIKLPITPATQTLIGLLAKLSVFATAKDVQDIVDAAAEILANHPAGRSCDERSRRCWSRRASGREWRRCMMRG